MFTATGLLHKEILIHHTTWTEVKSRWVTIHPQLLVTVVDSTACPPRSFFEVSGWTQGFLGVTATKIWMWCQQVRRQSFHFCSGGTRYKKRFDSFFCESLNTGHFQTALGTSGGGITPSRHHDHTTLSQKFQNDTEGKDALTQVLPLTQLSLVEGVLEERGLCRCVWHLRANCPAAGRATAAPETSHKEQDVALFCRTMNRWWGQKIWIARPSKCFTRWYEQF